MFHKILKAPELISPAPVPDGPSGYIVDTLCPRCRWLHESKTSCEAFPEGIPTVILIGVVDHTVPYSSGEIDDGGLVFDPI